MSKCGNDILLIVSILGVVFMLSTYTESFINPGSYPDHVTQPLLAPPHGDFNVKQQPKFIKANAAEVNAEEIKSSYKLFSKTPLKSFKQITNNQKKLDNSLRKRVNTFWYLWRFICQKN